jgi:hypothetical protein
MASLIASQEERVPLWVSHHLAREYFKAMLSDEILSVVTLSSISMRKLCRYKVPSYIG